MDVNDPRDSADEKDWRLEAQLHDEDRHGLGGLLGRLRGPDVVADAGDQATLQAARAGIENALSADGIVAESIRISHWDDERESWLQIDPPLNEDEIQALESAERAGDAVETRTMVASSGNLIRAEFEQTMGSWAANLGLECKIVEHPHLLKTQVAFTVTGPKRRIDEFARGLNAEGWATVRTETSVMISPL
jgi:hypothetical protein